MFRKFSYIDTNRRMVGNKTKITKIRLLVAEISITKHAFYGNSRSDGANFRLKCNSEMWRHKVGFTEAGHSVTIVNNWTHLAPRTVVPPYDVIHNRSHSCLRKLPKSMTHKCANPSIDNNFFINEYFFIGFSAFLLYNELLHGNEIKKSHSYSTLNLDLSMRLLRDPGHWFSSCCSASPSKMDCILLFGP